MYHAFWIENNNTLKDFKPRQIADVFEGRLQVAYKSEIKNHQWKNISKKKIGHTYVIW